MAKFTFFENWAEVFDALPDEECLSLFRALYRYGCNGEEPELERGSIEWLLWTSIKPNIDASTAKRAAGKAGGRPSSDEQESTDESMLKSTQKSTQKSTPKSTRKTTPKTDKEKERSGNRNGKGKEADVFYPSEGKKQSASPHGADGYGNAAPPSDDMGKVPSEYVSPYCSECGAFSPPTIGGFNCPRHGLRDESGVTFL